MLENQALQITSLNFWLVPHTQAYLPFHLGAGYPPNRVVGMSWKQNYLAALKVSVLIQILLGIIHTSQNIMEKKTVHQMI